MNDAAFMGILITSLVTLIGFMITIVTPIIKLNTTLTKLNETVKHISEENALQKSRVTEHGKEIDKLNDKVINHEVRLQHLEEKDK